MTLNLTSWFLMVTVVLNVFFLTGWAVQPAEAAPITKDEGKTYRLDYEFDFLPDDRQVRVTIQLSKNAKWVKSVRFNINSERHTQFEGDGKIKRQANYVTWYPPQAGGRLTYLVKIDRKRSSGDYGAYFAKDWVIFRGDHAVPPVKVRTEGKAKSQARLRLNMPSSWLAATAYESLDKFNFIIDDPRRRFDRPTGWIIVGDIGVRTEKIENTKVAVAGPKGQGIRRLDIMAFINLNLPELLAIFPDFHKRLLIVSADTPMWRGGLSGPGSLYIHKDRPMISENGTSTLIHELVHTAMRINGGQQDDWIVEGFAEFYSLELMRRSGTITERRFVRSMAQLSLWSVDIKKLRGNRSHGPITARAVLLMRELDQEIRELTHNKASLDDVARKLAGQGKINLKQFRHHVKAVVGSSLELLSERNPLLSD